MHRGDWFLGVAIFSLAAGIGLLACSIPIATELATGKFGTAADWASAFFGGLAVASAIVVGFLAWIAEHQRTAARGRVIAFRLAPYLIYILGDVRRARQAFEMLEKANRTDWGEALEAGIGAIHTAIPQDIFSDSWTLPPHIALCVAQLDHVLRGHSRLLKDTPAFIATAFGTDAKRAALSSLATSLTAIERLATEANIHCAQVSDHVAKSSRALPSA